MYKQSYKVLYITSNTYSKSTKVFAPPLPQTYKIPCQTTFFRLLIAQRLCELKKIILDGCFQQ